MEIVLYIVGILFIVGGIFSAVQVFRYISSGPK